MPANSKDKKRCSMCKSTAVDVKRCQQCGSSYYCSRKCQKDDWPAHKLLCATYKNFSQEGSRPVHVDKRRSYKLGILFPPNKKAPEFVWVECKIMVTKNGRWMEID